MKPITKHRRQRIKSLFWFVCIISIPINTFGIEPIATIGQPTPEYHVFLTNNTIVRSVSTHIQIVNGDTGAVIDEFAKRTNEIRDVIFSVNASHLAFQNYLSNPKRYIIEIWDVNTREQISEWGLRIIINSVHSVLHNLSLLPLLMMKYTFGI